jgi:hypothetical protein
VHTMFEKLRRILRMEDRFNTDFHGN